MCMDSRRYRKKRSARRAEKSDDRSIGSSTSGEIKREPGGKAAARRNDELNHRDDLIQGSATAHRDLIGHILYLPLWHCIYHCGSDHRRRQRIHRYAGAGYFFALNFGHCDHCCLRCGVSQHAGVAFFAGDRGDMEQSTIPALYHLWEDRLGRVIGSKKVNSEYTLHICGIGFLAFNISFPGYSGTIHQDVDRRKSLERVLDLLPNGYIADYGNKVLPKLVCISLSGASLTSMP